MSAEIRAITATVQCTVSGGDGHLSAMVDSRPWGLNSGKSQWFDGDNVKIICYISKNVNIVGTAAFGKPGQTIFAFDQQQPPPPTITEEGNRPPFYTYIENNIKREVISFSTPLSNISLPCTNTPIILSSNFVRCGDPVFLEKHTVVHLRDWEASLSPTESPPYGSIFVEYDPCGIIGTMYNVGIPQGLTAVSFSNNAIIYGVVTPVG